MGGPQDTIPPVIARSTPDSNAINFKGNQIIVQFNELIALNNPKEEIIVVPGIGKKTRYSVKGDRLIIEPELPWKENTTYVINFREGVEDLTEGTPLPDKQLAFSTGPDLDTLLITGSIKDALAETIPEKITIAIYAADTFDIFNHTPEYFTRSNKIGKYRITNLKPGTYRIYAFDDKNKNLKAESRNEAFGFLSAPIKLDTNTVLPPIPLVRVDSRPLKVTTVRNQSTVNTIRLNKPIIQYTLSTGKRMISHYASNQSEVIAYYPQVDQDSILAHFTALDSVSFSIDTTFYIKKDARDKIEETFRTNITDVTYIKETKDLSFTIGFNKPILAISPDSLRLQLDSATFTNLTPDELRYDTAKNKIDYAFKLKLDSLPPTAKLAIGKGYLISIDSDSTAAATNAIKEITPEGTASLLVELTTKERNFLVQVISSNNKILQTKANQLKPVFKNLNPENVKVRVIIDKNGNGTWDTAVYHKNQEPEPVIYYQNINKKFEVPLRANWEVGPISIKF